jgi:hypothetical protein
MTSFGWNKNNGGDWSTSTDWTPNGVPGASDTATISLAGTYTVTVSSAPESISSLLLNDANATLAISNTLALGNTLTVNAGTLSLNNGGTISGGTIVPSGGSELFNGGTLKAVTYQGPLNLNATNVLSVTGGITVENTNGTTPGTINVTGQNSDILFDDVQTVNNVVLNLGASSPSAFFDVTAVANTTATLTLGSNFTFNQVSNNAGIFIDSIASGIVNDGTFNATFAGPPASTALLLTATSNDFFTNNGTINVGNGDNFSLSQVTLDNINNHTITGGAYDVFNLGTLNLGTNEVSGTSSTITTDAADITLDGAGSLITTSAGNSIDGQLTSITTAGQLHIIGGRNFSTSAGLTDSGLFQLGGGTITGALTVASGGLLSGFGTVSPGVQNGGSIDASGGLLTLSVGPSGSGTLAADGGATLEIGTGSSENFRFNATNATLKLDDPSHYGGTLFGVAGGVTLDLVGESVSSASINNVSKQLVANLLGGGSITYNLDGTQDYVGDTVTPTPVDSGVLVIACFAAGTLIETPAGEVPVETLRDGDLVCAADGRSSPILWLASRTVTPGTFEDPARAHPVRIAAGAFGLGSPWRDLRLSPEHAVFADGMLVPIRHLINGSSIVQERVDSVRYFHIGLARHDVLLANGLPAESWRDEGADRGFENAPSPSVRALLPRRPCVPVVETGPAIELLRRRLEARANALGFDGPSVLDLVVGATGTTSVVVPAGTHEIRLRSEVSREGADRRRLGVAITGVRAEGCEIPLDDSRFARGFHTVEAHERGRWRWTEAEATIVVNATIDIPIEIDVVSVAGRAAQTA